jgi:hypothetical protein
MTFQDMVESIKNQDDLFELVRRRRIEQRQSEIPANSQRVEP